MPATIKKLKHLRYLAKYYPERLVYRHEVMAKRIGSRQWRAGIINVNANWIYNRKHGDW